MALKVTGLAILPFVLAGCATQSDHSAAPITQKSGSALTAQEYNFARQLVRSEIRRDDAVVTKATVTISSGKVVDSNIGEPCTSGRLLNIKLIGHFPHIVISPHPLILGNPGPASTVTAVSLTADAKSGRLCLMGAQIGRVALDPVAESLPLK